MLCVNIIKLQKYNMYLQYTMNKKNGVDTQIHKDINDSTYRYREENYLNIL